MVSKTPSTNNDCFFIHLQSFALFELCFMKYSCFSGQIAAPAHLLPAGVCMQTLGGILILGSVKVVIQPEPVYWLP
jgi:hypothetical protein